MIGTTVKLDHDQWIASFAAAWILLADGRADYEHLRRQGSTLFRVLSDKTPEEVARQHFRNSPEPEQLVRDPKAHFTQAAVDVGLIMLGDPIDQEVVDFGFEVAELCAAALDQRAGNAEGNAGDYIRALYGSNERRQ